MMADLIDRQAALAKFEPWLNVDGYSEGERNMLKSVLYELKVMPSVNVHEQIDNAYMHGYTAAEARYRDALRHGNWVASDEDGFVCSICRCGYKDQPTMMGKPMFDYCPVCGARMDGEKNG